MAHKSIRFKLLNLFILAVLMLLSAGLRAAAQTQDWTLIWSDNFSGAAGSAPNPNNWTLQQGLTSDGAQSYNCLYGQTTNGCNPATPNVYLDGNNHLIIKALAAAGAPNGVTSGRLFTSQHRQHSIHVQYAVWAHRGADGPARRQRKPGRVAGLLDAWDQHCRRSTGRVAARWTSWSTSAPPTKPKSTARSTVRLMPTRGWAFATRLAAGGAALIPSAPSGARTRSVFMSMRLPTSTEQYRQTTSWRTSPG